MSVLNKTPFIKSVLASLTSDQKSALLSLFDTKKEPTLYSFVNKEYELTTSAYGVDFIQLEVKNDVFTGYLVYNLTYCVLFAYDSTQNVNIYVLNTEHNTYEKLKEECSILELRAVLEHLSLAESGGLKREIVEELPEEDIDPNTIYMVLDEDATGNNIYNEYMYIGDAWELIGSTSAVAENIVSYTNVDLSSGSASQTPSGADWLLMTDATKGCALILYLATQSVYPLGDLVELKRISLSDDEVIFGANFEYPNNDIFITYEITARFTENAGAIVINEIEINKDLSQSNEEFPALHNITQGGETYVVDASKVQVNPVLDGTEAILLGLDVDGTKYQSQPISSTDGVKFSFATDSNFTIADSYSSYNRIGNQLTFVASFSITKTATTSTPLEFGQFKNIPASIFSKLVPTTVGSGAYLDEVNSQAFSDAFSSVSAQIMVGKGANSNITLTIDTTNLVENTKYHVRYQGLFLLTDNLSAIDPILANNSWGDIKAVCQSGDAGDYWSVGDTKTDTGTDGVVRTFRIADMQGLYSKHVVFEQVNVYDTTKQWNPSTNLDDDNAYNDYAISTMVSTHLPAYELLLSSDLQATLTNTTVKVAKNGNNGTILDVSGKLFLPAEKEVATSRSFSRTEEFSALTTWQYYSTHTTSSDRIKYDSTSTARAYWLRSPGSGYTGSVVFVFSVGNVSYDVAYSSYRVAPCFAY